MLRINQQRSPAGAAKYFDDGLAKGDYYTRDEIPGRWSGLAAQRLGLGGEVTREAFIALCDNLHPTTGERLTLRTREQPHRRLRLHLQCPEITVGVVHSLPGSTHYGCVPRFGAADHART